MQTHWAASDTPPADTLSPTVVSQQHLDIGNVLGANSSTSSVSPTMSPPWGPSAVGEAPGTCRTTPPRPRRRDRRRRSSRPQPRASPMHCRGTASADGQGWGKTSRENGTLPIQGRRLYRSYPARFSYCCCSIIFAAPGFWRRLTGQPLAARQRSNRLRADSPVPGASG